MPGWADYQEWEVNLDPQFMAGQRADGKLQSLIRCNLWLAVFFFTSLCVAVMRSCEENLEYIYPEKFGNLGLNHHEAALRDFPKYKLLLCHPFAHFVI